MSLMTALGMDLFGRGPGYKIYCPPLWKTDLTGYETSTSDIESPLMNVACLSCHLFGGLVSSWD